MAYIRFTRTVAAAVASLSLCMMPIASAAAPTGTTTPTTQQIEQRIQNVLGGRDIKWNVIASNPHVLVLHGTSSAQNLEISINCVITFNPFSIRCTINFNSSL